MIPAGEFWMGSDDDDREAYDDEKPKRKMRIPRRFALGGYPVTFEEFDLFCDATGRDQRRRTGLGPGTPPGHQRKLA